MMSRGMSDHERAEAVTRALEETTSVLRDCLWELSSHREVDNEMQLIKDNESLIGKMLKED
jgi:hypothetical protein